MATKVNVISYRKRNGMYMEGTALKGQLFNLYNVSSVGPDADTSTITAGVYMFPFRPNLTSWTAPLPNLVNGDHMFYDTGLTSWTVDLPELTNGNVMFQSCKFTSWTVDLPELANGSFMFAGCKQLASFSGDLPNLTNGSYMFQGCIGLTSFSGDLSNLTNGNYMFEACNLDEASILNIVNSIPTHTSGTHQMHLGKYTNYQTSVAVAAKLRTAGGGTVSTPIAAATNYRCVDDNGNDKGWTITITA